MEDRKGISIGKLAALERAKALDLPVRVPAVSPFEHQASEWKRRSEVGSPKSEVQGPMSEVRTEKDPQSEIRKPATSIQQPATSNQQPASSTEHPVSSMNEGFDWKPYQSERGEGKKGKDLNTASVSLMARKIMAREWAMALGRGRGLETEQVSFEHKAEEYRQKKAAEREKKEIEDQRIHRQRAAVEAALRDFGRNLLEAPKPVAPEAAEALLEKSFSKVGDTMRIAWEPERGNILIEPWEEKRLRRESGETMPALFQATIDANLMLSSFEKIQDPQLLKEIHHDLLLKNILSSFSKSPRKDMHTLESAVSECGRIIRSTKMHGGWMINFEPWEEMRKRNVERKGRPPIVTYVIKADKDFNNISCERI